MSVEVETQCIMGGNSLQGRGLKTQLVFEERLLLRQLLSSIVDERNLPVEVTVAGCETVDLDADETGNIQFGQCFFLGWM